MKDTRIDTTMMDDKTLDVRRYANRLYLESNEDTGDRELDFYLGWQSKTESNWKDPAAEELFRRDYYVNHVGWSPGEYSAKFKLKGDIEDVEPTWNQLPPIREYKRSFTGTQPESDRSKKPIPWKHRRQCMKFMSKKNRDTSPPSSSLSSSDQSYESEKIYRISYHNPPTISHNSERIMDGHRREYFPHSRTNNKSDETQGARIREIVEGKPCDNCPETCPGFQPHSWRSVAACLTDMGILHQIDNKLAYLVQLCSRGWSPKVDKGKERVTTPRSVSELAPRRMTPKFPSRERNYALRRRRRNKGATSGCAACARRNPPSSSVDAPVCSRKH